MYGFRKLRRRPAIYGHQREHFTWRRLLVLAATMTGSKARPLITLTVAHIADTSRESTTALLKEFEKCGYVERVRSRHNRCAWWGTKQGLTKIRQEAEKRVKLTREDDLDRLALDPVRFIKTAMRVHVSLRKYGWTDLQTRRRMKRAPLGFLVHVIKAARSKESPGAYAMASTRTRKEDAKSTAKRLAFTLNG